VCVNNLNLKGLVYGMSGILIPCVSDAGVPEFMALCIRPQDVKETIVGQLVPWTTGTMPFLT